MHATTARRRQEMTLPNSSKEGYCDHIMDSSSSSSSSSSSLSSSSSSSMCSIEQNQSRPAHRTSRRASEGSSDTSCCLSSSPPTKTNHSRRERSCRKVHWGPHAVYPTIHVSSMSDDLISTIWYTPDEYSSIRRQNSQTINLMSKKGSAQVTSDSIHCTRGLEHRTKYGSQRKNELIISSLAAILGEQERLRMNHSTGEVASQSLANMYTQISIEAQSAAFIRGLKDEQDIKGYLRNASSSSSTTMTTWGQSSFGWSSMESICLDDEGCNENEKEEANTTNGGDDHSITSERHQIDTGRLSQPLLCGAAA